MKIRHIGYVSLCRAKCHPDNIGRIDLGAARYRQLGVKERLKNEAPYRVCKRCIAIIKEREGMARRFTVPERTPRFSRRRPT